MLRLSYVSAFLVAGCFLAASLGAVSTASEPVEIGRRLELFVDDYLIAETLGDVKRQLMLPEPQEVVFETDELWEGNTSGYYGVFQDDNVYRMIYRGWQHDSKAKAAHQEVTCYAESKDGIHW